MATEQECQSAIIQLAASLADSSKSKDVLERTVSCELTDTGVTYRGELRDGGMHDVTTEPGDRAQIRMRMTSDDLVALSKGELNLASAWLSGRVKIEANLMDLLKLKKML